MAATTFKPGDTDNNLLRKILDALLTGGGGGGGGGGTGTVTSVGLSMPAGFSVSGSPVTTAGTLAVTLDSQAANLFLASPSGGAGSPFFRALNSADMPAGFLPTSENNSLYVQNRTGVTGLVGGGPTNLDGIPTVGVTVGKRIIMTVTAAGVHAPYILIASTAATSSPFIVRPTDYAPGTNEKVWIIQELGFQDRTTGDGWIQFVDAGLWRLFTGASSIFTVSNVGLATATKFSAVNPALTNWDTLILSHTADAAPGIKFLSGVAAAAARNWGFALNYNLNGDFVLNESNAKNGDPMTAGTTRFSVASGGAVSIPGTLNVTGAVTTLDLILTGSKPANLFLASPSGGAGAPAFRAIASADLPAGTPTAPAILVESGASSKISALPLSAGLALVDLFGVVDDPAGTPASQKSTVQQVFDATNVLIAAGALATSDKIAGYQAGGKSLTVQQIFDATNVLTGASSPLAPSAKLAAFQTTGKSATVQQVLDAIDGLSAAGAIAGTDTLAVIQAAAAKEATFAQVLTYMQANFNLNGSAFTTVGGSASATTNGTNLLAAYAAAAAATPHGAAKSTTNRYTIYLLPGTFDLAAGTLTMNLEFVDIVGLGRTINGPQIAAGAGGGCLVTSGGTTINKSSNNAHLMNFACCTSGAAAGTPGFVGNNLTTSSEILAFMFFSNQISSSSADMATGKAYGGYYYRCQSTGDGIVANGGFGSGAGGNATGIFVGCKAGANAFGGPWVGNGIASGIFIDCEAGFNSFGAADASGLFYNCRMSDSYVSSSGGFMFGDLLATGTFIYCDVKVNNCVGFGRSGPANGTFLWCRATAVGSFGATGSTTGVFKFCTGAANAFGVGVVTIGGTYDYCIGGDNSWGGAGGTCSGTFRNCVGGNGSFGGFITSGTGGTCAGTFVNCTGGNSSFGGSVTTGGTASGTFINCVAGTNGFASGATTGGTMSGLMLNCRMVGNAIWNLTGKIENMRIEATAANTSAVALVSTSTGALYNCTLIGTGTGISIDIVTGTPTVKIAHCRLNKGINAAITNSIGTPYNVDDTDII